MNVVYWNAPRALRQATGLLVCWRVVWRICMKICLNLNARIHSKIVLKIYEKNIEKSFNIDPKFFKNRPETIPDRWKCVLGTFSAPNRAQVGSRTLGAICRVTLLAPFWSKMPLQGTILEASGVPKSIKNRTFGPRSAQGPSKNDLWKEGWKKHENFMKNRCKNGCFLMARNHVWRYTLRLFHTFAVFEKNRKIDAKREPKNRL